MNIFQHLYALRICVVDMDYMVQPIHNRVRIYFLPHSLRFITRNCPKNVCVRKSFLSLDLDFSETRFRKSQRLRKDVFSEFREINSYFVIKRKSSVLL